MDNFLNQHAQYFLQCVGIVEFIDEILHFECVNVFSVLDEYISADNLSNQRALYFLLCLGSIEFIDRNLTYF